MEQSGAHGEIARSFATVIIYTLVDGFGLDPRAGAEALADAEDLVRAAQTQATTDQPTLPAAVRLESLDQVYTRALNTYTPPETGEGAVMGRQGDVDDWAWLITDALVNAFSIAHNNRIGVHARSAQLVQRLTGEAPSVYLPAAIRQRLATY